MEQVLQAISSVGFPIAMTLILVYYVYIKDKSHAEEINKLSEAVNAQTLNIQRLIDKIDKILDKEGD